MNLYTLCFDSPIGVLEIETNENSLLSVSIIDKKRKASKIIPLIARETYKQLNEYFKGTRTKFNLRILLEGTEFQKKVWNQLINIPYGQIETYRGIAENIGNIKASRAVGNANNKNKILIIVPCHRVIASSGKLNGYREGIEKKEWLLNHEKSIVKSIKNPLYR